MDVTLNDAYAEACRALGEAIVTQRLMGAEIARLDAVKAESTATVVDQAMTGTPTIAGG